MFWQKFRKETIVFIATILIVGLYFGKLFYPVPSLYLNPEYGRSDVSHFNIPVRYIYSEALQRNELPFWSKDIGTGFPILAESQMGAFYIPNLILYKSFPFWFAFNMSYALAFVIGILGMYFFIRLQTKYDFISLAVGIMFMFSGYIIPHTNHLNMIQTASLIPWMFYVFEKAVRSRKLVYYPILVLLISQHVLIGHLQTSFIAGIMLLAYATLNVVDKEKWIDMLKQYAYISSAFALGLFLSLVQIIPSFELHSLSVRSEGFSLNEALFYSFGPKALLTFINPYLLGKLQDGSYIYLTQLRDTGNIFWESNAYLGLVALFGLVLSIKFIKSKKIWSLWIVIGSSILMMLAKHSPLYFVYSIPPFNIFTTPARFVLVAQFFILLLSALVFKRLNLSKHVLIGLVVFVILDAFVAWYGYGLTIPYSEYVKKPEIANRILQDDLPDSEKRVMNFDSGSWLEDFTENGWDSEKGYTTYFNELNPNMNVLWAIPHHRAYVGRIWTRRQTLYDQPLAGLFHPDKDSLDNKVAVRLLSKSSTDYIVTTHALEEVDTLDKMYSSKVTSLHGDAYNIYSVTEAQPRFFMTDNVAQISSLRDFTSAMIASDEAYLADQALVEELSWTDPEPGKSLDYSVEVINDENLVLDLRVNTNKDALLTVADLYYPGWQAFVNESEVTLYATNLIQRGIVVPKGDHTIRLAYKPSNFNTGLWVTIGGYTIALLAVAVLGYRGR